jgi:hypothetical protein
MEKNISQNYLKIEISDRKDNATAQMVSTSIRIEKTNIVKRGKNIKYRNQFTSWHDEYKGVV